MAYRMYLGEMLCPVTPSKIDTKIKGQNKTLTLINDGQISILKSAGLTEVSFDLLLPNVEYPFAEYNSGFQNAKYYLDELERLKVEKKPFFYKVIRALPNGTPLYDTEMKVSLEEYTIKEDKKQGFDFLVSVKLKQYRDYATKTIKIDAFNKALTEQSRPTDNAPKTNKYIVAEGDTLGIIAKKFYGDSSKYMIIYEANKDVIGGNPAAIQPGQELTIPDISKATAGTSSGSGGRSSNKVNIYFTLSSGVREYKGYVKIRYVENGKSKIAEYKSSSCITIDRGSTVEFDIYNNVKTTYANCKLNKGNASSWWVGRNLCTGNNVTESASVIITWIKPGQGMEAANSAASAGSNAITGKNGGKK